MREKIGGMPLREYGALLFRKSMISWRPKRLAEELEVSESYVHKFMEGERDPKLRQWLKTIQVTGDLEGVKRLAQDLGFVLVRKNGDLGQTLRDLAEEAERGQRSGAG